ncbi:MAG: AI-2E family transporter [Chloroflexi bacterium]|nr:AI-2E family transporter [Chloroflexota bacterium]
MPKPATSPHWSNTTKLIAGFTMVAIVAAILVRFSSFIGPLLLAFILTYLLNPLARRLSVSMQLSWRAAVNLIFIAFLLIIVLLSTVAGFAIVDQLDNLVRVLQTFLTGLPELARSLSTQAVQIGPFEVDFAGLERLLLDEFGMDFTAISQQLLSAIQPALGQAGSLITALATSTVTTIGWALFIFIISYLTLTEMGSAPDFFRNAELPGHDADIRRMGRELGRTWNSFLRGQLLLVTLITITSFILMSLFGVRYALAIAFLTGFAKFVPYVGSLAMYITVFLVALFQDANYLNIQPEMTYAIIVAVAAILLDQTFDNIVTPRIYGRALGVHPAAVLVTALIAANLLGVVGLLLAAPVLASLQLFATYTLRKMLDLDPWPQVEKMKEPEIVPLARPLQRLIDRVKRFLSKRKKKTAKK